MQQITQNIRNGELSVLNVPDPIARPGYVLIANEASVISAGTEKMAIDLARKSLLGKARERPDHVRRVRQKMRQEGFFATLAQVSEKLDEPMSLGYASAGTVLACGAGVQAFKPGDRVASNGPHAGVVCVPEHLCAHVPPAVPADHAAFAVLGAIALNGVRLAHLELGDTAFVIGLGLIGQITVALLKAQGCRVIATDPDAGRCSIAVKMGAERATPNLSSQDIANLTAGLGADAVLIAAATKSDSPVDLAGQAVRKKGRVVVVGAVGMNLPRRPYYFKEAEFMVACSYGPGRYDPEYEDRGHDYPAAYVRWTEQRNMQAVLDLMAAGRLDVSPLISQRFPIDQALEAYKLVEDGTQPYLGLLLQYPESATRQPASRIELRASPVSGKLGIGCIGAGSFARAVTLPLLRQSDAFHLRILCSAGGLSAAHAGEKHGFDSITTSENEVYGDAQVRAVFVLTRHDQHAAQVASALKAGKSVFVEKPLCLTLSELSDIESLISNLQSPFLQVGFNRRFSPAAQLLKEHFSNAAQPLTISIRINAGEIPSDHWTQDELTGGGRIIGEACHAIDLATFLAGSRPVRVFAESVGGRDAKAVTDDQCFITLRHENGAVSSIAYVSGGDRAFSKERVEVFGGGRVAVIDDFREVTLVENGHVHRRKLQGQDKGHRGELAAFSTALAGGHASPTPWAEVKAVSLASMLAVQSIREGMPFEIS
ncbi:MAG TPA: bi-domain-containing oxidoreductase [Kiritimatiellia bacterium]|nr:bi-domain-containing oxidoreductase [Kiritimatiellia bacterium]